jgi:predicted alpha/beta-fold hydrolase
MYHAGETTDLAFLLEWLQARFPGLPVGAAGFSLGANILLKYLGTTGADAGVEAAAAISPPFDLTRSTNAISTGFSQIYSRGFLKKLKRKAARLALHHDSRIDLERVRAARTLNDFDNAVIAPLFGFRDADDYYAQSSSGRYLADIRRPTFILRALDDPFFDPDDIPLAVIAANPYLSAEFPPHGGHVGFVEGRKSFWAEKETARFFAHEFSEDKHGQGSR